MDWRPRRPRPSAASGSGHEAVADAIESKEKAPPAAIAYAGAGSSGARGLNMSPAYTASGGGGGIDLSSLHEKYSRQLEVGWNSRLAADGERGKAGIPEYNALRDRHCTYTRSKAFRTSPYARLAQRVKQLGGATGAGALAGAGFADRSVLREFLEEANRQEELQAKGEWGAQKNHPLSAPAPFLPPVDVHAGAGPARGAALRSALGVASPAPPRGVAGTQAGALLEMQVFKCILVREALLSKAKNLARRLRHDPTDIAALRGTKAARRARYRVTRENDPRQGRAKGAVSNEPAEEGLAALLDRLRVCTGPCLPSAPRRCTGVIIYALPFINVFVPFSAFSYLLRFFVLFLFGFCLPFSSLSAVEACEAVMRWRKSFRLPKVAGTSLTEIAVAPAASSVFGGYKPPFMWNGRNYVLQMTADMDFLATVPPLADAVSFDLQRNPFTMPASLDALPRYINDALEEAHADGIASCEPGTEGYDKDCGVEESNGGGNGRRPSTSEKANRATETKREPVSERATVVPRQWVLAHGLNATRVRTAAKLMLDEELVFGKWYDGACEAQPTLGPNLVGRGRVGQGRKQKLHQRHQAHMRRFQQRQRSQGGVSSAPDSGALLGTRMKEFAPSHIGMWSADNAELSPEQRLQLQQHRIQQAQLREVRFLFGCLLFTCAYFSFPIL